MLLRLSLEIMKLKRRSFLWTLIALVLIGLLWTHMVTVYKLNDSQLLLSKFYDIAVVNSMIMPLFISVLAARLLELEHLGKTFKLLQTSNETPWQLFTAKWLLMGIFLGVIGLVQFSYLFVFFQLQGAVINCSLCLSHFICFLLIGMWSALLHLYIAFIYEKQSVTIVLGLVGAFIALVTGGMLPRFIQIFLPWQYYVLFCPIHRQAIEQMYLFTPDAFFLAKMIGLLAILCLGFVLIKKRFRKVDFL